MKIHDADFIKGKKRLYMTATPRLYGDEAKTKATDLAAALQKIQSSAKQKHKMLDEDGAPATNFSTDGYLIGTRLDARLSVTISRNTGRFLKSRAIRSLFIVSSIGRNLVTLRSARQKVGTYEITPQGNAIDKFSSKTLITR
ncbi:MAG: hypothetical protein RLZZ398_1671 [Verrucomicrobiota bacterium]